MDPLLDNLLYFGVPLSLLVLAYLLTVKYKKIGKPNGDSVSTK